MLLVFLLSNVVAAGVFIVLGPLVAPGNGTMTVIGMYAIGILAAMCSILFIAGALHQIPRWLSTLLRKF